MSTVTGGDDVNIAQDQDHDDDNVDIPVDNTDEDGNGTGTATTGGAAGGGGTTNFNLRVEQNKIPEFFGTKSKDTISSSDFIRRLEDLARTNRWNYAQTYHHFANALRNPAREWLSSVVDWNNDETIQPLWSDFKDLFKQEYAVQTNERLILEGLANLAMKPNETTNELLIRITRTTRVIKESYAEYGGKIPNPHNDRND
jgi:hypothetical protein